MALGHIELISRKYLYLLQLLSNMHAVFSVCDSGMIYVYVLLQLLLSEFQKKYTKNIKLLYEKLLL